MPQVGDFVLQQLTKGKTEKAPENEVLYLPSDFSEAERVQLQLVALGEHERRLQSGAAYDTIRRIRTTSKTISSLRSDKKAQAYGQTRHTRAADQIRKIEARRDAVISDYQAIRAIMISLGLPVDSAEFPPLTLADTYRKPTDIKRAVGDSQRHEGSIWTNAGISAGVRLPRRSTTQVQSKTDDHLVGTQSSRLKRTFNDVLCSLEYNNILIYIYIIGRAPPIKKGPRGKSRRLNPKQGVGTGMYPMVVLEIELETNNHIRSARKWLDMVAESGRRTLQ